MFLSRFMVFVIDRNQSSDLSPAIERGVLRFLNIAVFSGMTLSLVSGVYQLSRLGLEYVKSNHLFHMKFLLVFIMIGITFAFKYYLKPPLDFNKLSKAKLMAVHGSSALIMVIIVFITFISTR